MASVYCLEISQLTLPYCAKALSIFTGDSIRFGADLLLVGKKPKKKNARAW